MHGVLVILLIDQKFMKKTYLSLLSFIFILLCEVPMYGQQYQPNWGSLDKRQVPGWFNEAKFGIFIHWGVYSVPSFSRVVPDGYSEWYWCNLRDTSRQNHKTVTEFHNRTYGAGFTYEQFVPMFRTELFDPDEWADIFKRSGAKYVVLTSKHHDGFCLWPSAEADKAWGVPWNSVSAGPQRDLVGDLTNSVKRTGLKMGFYYSLMEWYNPVFLIDKDRYVDEVMIPQFKDLVTKYRPSVIFSDGEWIMEEEQWKSTEILSWLFTKSPVKEDIVVNDRWGKSSRAKHPATYYTSEYGSGMDKRVVWEESRGMGQSYGYNRMEKLNDYKSAEDLIIILVDIVSRGGNLLLDIGPAADGTIPVIMEERLTEMGRWLKRNGEAIYGTSPWKFENQWSEGPKPVIEKGHYQTNFDITQIVKHVKNQAYIQMFFTRKNTDLYCVVPQYSQKISVDGISPCEKMKVNILGCQKQILWKINNNRLEIDLSHLQPGDIEGKIFVIKISEVL